MRFIVRRYVDGKFYAIGITCLFQKLFCLLNVSARTVNAIQVRIVIRQGRQHSGANDLTVTAGHEFICTILIKRIADSLTNLHVIQRCLCIVQE